MLFTGISTNQTNSAATATTPTTSSRTSHFRNRLISLLPLRSDAYYKQRSLPQEVIVNWSGSVASPRTTIASLLILLVSCLPIPVLGESPGVVTLTPGAAVHVEKLADSLDLLEDRVGDLDVVAVSTAPVDARFISAKLQSTNIGFSTAAWWVRVRIDNPAESSRLVYLRQDYPLIDSVDFYEPATEGGWRARLPVTASLSAPATCSTRTSCSR